MDFEITTPAQMQAWLTTMVAPPVLYVFVNGAYYEITEIIGTLADYIFGLEGLSGHLHDVNVSPEMEFAYQPELAQDGTLEIWITPIDDMSEL